MSMILESPKDIEAALAFPSRAAHTPTEQYLVHIVELAVENRRRMAVEQLRQHLENQVLGPAIRKGIEQGRQEGRQEGIAYALQAVLKAHFGPLPPWALTKITEAPFETQDRWLQTDPANSTLEEFLR